MGWWGARIVARACSIIALVLVESHTLVVCNDYNAVWSVSLYIVALCGIIIVLHIFVLLPDSSVCSQGYWTCRQIIVWSVHGVVVISTVINQSVLRMCIIFMNIQCTESCVWILILCVNWSHAFEQISGFLFFNYSSNVFCVSFCRFTGRLRSHSRLTELLPRVTVRTSFWQTASGPWRVLLWYLTATPTSTWATSTLVKNGLKVHPVSVVSANLKFGVLLA